MGMTTEVQHALMHIEEVSVQNKPVVVIVCCTYNHEKYLRDALDGFVMQQTDFPFVAVVHDDASSDDTANILRDYAKKYPDIILPIYEKENLYLKHSDSMDQIMQKAIAATGAKYIAFCEGDDYWTDPLKLQKQVDFLETHPDYSMCFHNVVEHWEDGSLTDLPKNSFDDRDFTGIDLYDSYVVPTASIVVRDEVLYHHRYLRAAKSGKFKFGDLLICLSAFEIGKIRYSAEIGSIYRRHANGATFTVLKDPFVLPGCHRFIPKYFGFKYFVPVRNRIITVYRNLTLANFKDHNFKVAIRALLLAFKYDPFYTIYSFLKYFWWKKDKLLK